jgi:cyclase
MDRDGTGIGFDCELTARVSDAVRIPVIASGGAGGAPHFVEVFAAGRADAALAASIFHFGLSSISELKQQLQSSGVPMRLPC